MTLFMKESPVANVPDELSGKFANMSVVAALSVVLIHCYVDSPRGSSFWWFTEIVGGGRLLSGSTITTHHSAMAATAFLRTQSSSLPTIKTFLRT